MGEVEHLPDLAIGQPLCRELDDLELLGCEFVPRFGGPAAAGLSRSSELLACPIAPGDRAECIKRLAGGAKRGAGFRDSPALAQPFAPCEEGACAEERPCGVPRLSRVEQGFGVTLGRQQGTRVA